MVMTPKSRNCQRYGNPRSPIHQTVMPSAHVAKGKRITENPAHHKEPTAVSQNLFLTGAETFT
jgi:hypothetical protein